MNQKKDAIRLDEWGDPISTSDANKTTVQSAAEAFEKTLYETDWDASPKQNKETAKRQNQKKHGIKSKTWIVAASCVLAVTIFIVTWTNGRGTQNLQNVVSIQSEQDQIIQVTQSHVSTKTPQPSEQKPSVAPTLHAISVPTALPPTPKITNTPEPDLMAAAKEWYGIHLRYYYHQLSAHEKSLFELLYSGINDFSNKIMITSGHFTKAELERAVFAINQDCPELIQFSGNLKCLQVAGSEVIVSIALDYTMTRDEYDRKKSEIQQIIHDLKGKTQFITDGFEKEKLAYRYIIDHCEYEAVGEKTSRADSVLCDGHAQCAGYSRGLSLLLRSLNIPCIQVGSVALDHEWNLVQINGNWYHCDVTWDDEGDENTDQGKMDDLFFYLNVPSRLMAKHKPDCEKGFFLPECTHLEDNYVYREGVYISGSTNDKKAELNGFLNKAYNLGKREIAIMIDDWPAFNNRNELISDFSSAHSIGIWTSDETETCTFFLEVKE